MGLTRTLSHGFQKGKRTNFVMFATNKQKFSILLNHIAKKDTQH